jgi:hypothetical protein
LGAIFSVNLSGANFLLCCFSPSLVKGEKVKKKRKEKKEIVLLIKN